MRIGDKSTDGARGLKTYAQALSAKCVGSITYAQTWVINVKIEKEAYE